MILAMNKRSVAGIVVALSLAAVPVSAPMTN